MKRPIPFGKYYLLERINVGGMAEVFKAKATGVEGFERLVAVKRILPSIAEDEEFITMFVDEAKIAVQLTHANIAQIFDLGRVDGSFFIALEYVHGKDLRTMFNRARQRAEMLPIPLVCYVVMKICEGLDYAHNKHDSSGRFLNLVHRDVSPQNVLVSYEGEVKIIDFGIAKAAGKSGRTQAGILKGKFGYMSPEQAQGLEIDRRSDVFGVGICLYELLTGERLFVAESDFATLSKVRSVDIMPPSTYNRRVPEELEQIVMRALAREREERHQSALQLHDELQAFLHTSGNMFSRKALSSYMHRAFAEEIEKESARDREFEQLDESGDAPSRLEDEIDTLDVQPLHALAALSAMPEEAPLRGPIYPEVRKRTATLLGVPRAAAPRVPVVPRPVPGPASIPPPATASSVRPMDSASGPVNGDATPGMDWDEEDLSTQIYDKPEIAEDALAALRVSLPPHDAPAGEGAEQAAARERAATPQQQASPGPATPQRTATPQHVPAPQRQPTPQYVPTPQRAGTPQHGTAPARRNTGAGQSQRRPTNPQAQAAQVPRQHPLRTDPSFAHLPPADTTATGVNANWARRSDHSRPMWVAVASVVTIVTCVVVGLMLFGQRQPGTVNLSTQPNRVSVSVDGRSLGESTSPFVIGELSAGKPHNIVVSSPGYVAWSHDVTLTPGQVVTLPSISLKRIETGFALSTDPPGATVFVDERALSEHTPVRVVDLAPGEHRIRVEYAGWAPWSNVVHVTAGTVSPLPEVQLQSLAVAQPDPSLTRGARKGRARAARSDSADVTEDESDTPVSAPKDRAHQNEAAETPEDLVPTSKPSPVDKAAKPDKPDKPSEADKPEREDKPAARDDKSLDDLLGTSDATGSQPAHAAETGTLRVNSRPWSQVFIDGKAYGATPRMNIELPAGSHTLELVNKEYGLKRTRDVTITPGKVETLVVNLNDE